ncbi:MAG: PilZ domain-containing protein [Candidatus Omnitrophica bacterium]|nr:PilZ domain-containing protein [Candidatus Omnitrophota bacterium]
MSTQKQKNDERRRFERRKLKKAMECQFVSDANISDIYRVKSHNISQAGLLLEAQIPIPLGSTIAIEVEKEKLDKTVEVKKLQSYIEIDVSNKSFVRLCGKVVRVEKKKDDLFYVAVHLINK